MRVEYDPDKAEANFTKHRVSFADAAGVLEDPLALTVEDPDAVGERRYVTIGQSSAGELLVVVHAQRAEVHRLISARRATRRERNQYES